MKSQQTFGYNAAYIVFFLVSVFLYLYTSAFGVLLFWALCLCIVIIESGFLLLFRVINKKNLFEAFRGIFQIAFRHTMILTALVCVGSGGSMLYYNEVNPATLSLYTLTNGEKTVQFQEMSHIAAPNFFALVKNRLTQARNAGWSIFYEGVRASDPKTEKEFQKELGFQLDASTYDKIATRLGLLSQNNEIIGVDESKDLNVDLTLEEILKRTRSKNASGNMEKNLATQEPVSLDDILPTLPTDMTDRQNQFLEYAFRAMLNATVWEASNAALLESFGKEAILDTILNDRNKVIVDAINKSENKKIYVTYGALHFPWVFSELKKADIRWRIIRQEIILPLKK